MERDSARNVRAEQGAGIDSLEPTTHHKKTATEWWLKGPSGVVTSHDGHFHRPAADTARDSHDDIRHSLRTQSAFLAVTDLSKRERFDSLPHAAQHTGPVRSLETERDRVMARAPPHQISQRACRKKARATAIAQALLPSLIFDH